MKKVAYYISDYGYGHASRSIAIIRKLLLSRIDLKIIVCHSFALSFLKASLLDNRVSYRNIHTDIGFLLQKNSFEPDRSAMEWAYIEFLYAFPKTFEVEREFLLKEQIDLVISDISPLPYLPAKNLGIPSIGISNFTWFTGTQGLISEPVSNKLFQLYKPMDFYFQLAGANEPNWGNIENKHFSFFSRNIDHQEVKRIRNEVGIKKNEFLIYIGIGMKIDLQLSSLPLWNSTNCKFIVSSNAKLKKRNVYTIPHDYQETQNYIAACDLVISKPGWGTVSEAVIAQKPLLLIYRQKMKEDQNTVQYLKEKKRCHTIEWTEFEKIYLDESFIKKIRNSQHLNGIQDSLSEIVKGILTVLDNNK